MRVNLGTFLGLALVAALPVSASATPYNDLATFLADAGPTTLVDFDAATTGDILGTYASLGVTFSPGNFFAACIGPVSPPGCWINNTSDGADGRLFDAQFTVGGITAVGLNSVLNGSHSTLRAFDAGNNLIEQVSSDADNQSLDFFGLITTVPIDHITVDFEAPVFGWAVDDLRFSVANPVPEPSTLALLGAGFVALRGRRRRA
jgi:hypothetical protein